MTVRIGVACEDRGHFRVCTHLIDGALLRAFSWLDGALEYNRAWCGIDEGTSWYKYDRDDARTLPAITLAGTRVHRHGFVAGEPLKAESRMLRSILLLFCRSDPRPDAVLLVRDLDGYPERRDGITQVRDGYQWPFPIVTATPQPEIEAWEIACFEPFAEIAATVQEDLKLNFNPFTEFNRLTSQPRDAKTDAKRTLAALKRSAGLDDRDNLELGTLPRAPDNELSAFLTEIERDIVPLFGRPS